MDWWLLLEAGVTVRVRALLQCCPTQTFNDRPNFGARLLTDEFSNEADVGIPALRYLAGLVSNSVNEIWMPEPAISWSLPVCQLDRTFFFSPDS